MTSVDTEILRQPVADARTPRATTLRIRRGSGLRLVVGALAVLVLIGLGALDPRRPASDLAASGTSSLVEPGRAPAYDGRGKWSGY